MKWGDGEYTGHLGSFEQLRLQSCVLGRAV